MATVAVSFELLTVEHGVWCDACGKSSAHTVWFTTTTNGQSTLRSKTVCEEQ